MRIINRERGSGKTTILIGAAAATGARIITPTEDMARFVASEARKNGFDILEPILPEKIPEGEVFLIGCDVSQCSDFTAQTEIKIGGKTDA